MSTPHARPTGIPAANSGRLPAKIEKAAAPPIKCQGIKTRLVGFIAESIRWEGAGRWIEPFLGSGTVLFNIKPRRAVVSDTNAHIIRVYNDLKAGRLAPEDVAAFLRDEGALLKEKGEDHFYALRERFNNAPNSLDFIFLTRACFNGVMRFNKKGFFNVPFCRKPDRFRQAYITRIVNQVARIRDEIRRHDWEFVARGWREPLAAASPDDFVYADPPYSGRHTDYFNQWTDAENRELVESLLAAPCGFALSTWLENRYRRNPLFEDLAGAGLAVRTYDHFYHVGSSEAYRNKMVEALVLDPAHAA